MLRGEREIWTDISQDNWIKKMPIVRFSLLVFFLPSSLPPSLFLLLKSDATFLQGSSKDLITWWKFPSSSLLSIIQKGNEHRTYCCSTLSCLVFFLRRKKISNTLLFINTTIWNWKNMISDALRGYFNRILHSIDFALCYKACECLLSLDIFLLQFSETVILSRKNEIESRKISHARCLHAPI